MNNLTTKSWVFLPISASKQKQVLVEVIFNKKSVWFIVYDMKLHGVTFVAQTESFIYKVTMAFITAIPYSVKYEETSVSKPY